jgi:hypothetical protein
MESTRLLALLGLSTLIACATEKAATEKAAPAPQTRTFTVPLTTGAEVPPCASAGANASGMANITVASDDSSISVTVSYTGLSGEPTAAHLHAGPASAAGPVVLPFSGSLATPFSKTFTAADYLAAPGAPPDFGSFVTALKAGGAAYVNVHTAACKPGEIRGEIQ